MIDSKEAPEGYIAVEPVMDCFGCTFLSEENRQDCFKDILCKKKVVGQ
jgi:hypothetical protein